MIKYIYEVKMTKKIYVGRLGVCRKTGAKVEALTEEGGVFELTLEIITLKYCGPANVAQVGDAYDI
jgi:hypothetical protein